MKELTSIFLLFTSILFGQKTFLGESPSEIEQYWKSRTNSENVKKESDENNKVVQIFIMVGNVGTASFVAYFNEKGKCDNSITSLKDNKVDAVILNMKNNGYFLNKTNNTWINNKLKTEIKIEDIFGENSQLIATLIE
jgi:hypothetical protein